MATTAIKQHIPIFISSTYRDLSSHRAEVEKRLVGLEQIVKGMEYFGSNPDTPLVTCLSKLENSKLMILIIGVSYGSIVPGTNKSFTETEYEFAIKQNIPILVYIADTKSPNIGIPIDSVDIQYAAELSAFKEKLKGIHTVSFFTSVEDLGSHIEHDVPEVLKRIDNIKIANSRNIILAENVSEQMLEDGAKKFEHFWLRPAKFAGEIVPVRLRINKKWGGWKVRDELIRSVGLDVGDCISTEVTIKFTQNIIDDGDDTDLFASGEGADWLLENAARQGSVCDCYVRFVYNNAPIGKNDKIVSKISLIFVKGIRYVECDKNYVLSVVEESGYNDLIMNLINNNKNDI